MPPLVLSIETATLGGSVSVSRGNRILSARRGDSRISHSSTLLSDIDQVLGQAGVMLEDIEVYAVAIGPGSFTGLRIGIATVKALATTLERPCAGISTLAAIAHAAGPSQQTISLLPAGRGEVFAQAFAVSSDRGVVEQDIAIHVSPLAMLERYSGSANPLLAGEGARIHTKLVNEWLAKRNRQLLNATGIDGWRIAAAEDNLSTNVAALALVKIQANKLEEPNKLRAIYVRPSDAEINLRQAVRSE